MVVFFKSHQITIRRLRRTSGYKSNYSATGTVHPADVQPAGPDRVEQGYGRIGEVYECWIGADVDIRETDQVDCDGVRYSVRAVEYWHGAGLLDSKHLILVSQNSA